MSDTITIMSEDGSHKAAVTPLRQKVRVSLYRKPPLGLDWLLLDQVEFELPLHYALDVIHKFVWPMTLEHHSSWRDKHATERVWDAKLKMIVERRKMK